MTVKRVTGTHLYTYAKCPHAVALDLHGERDARRPWTEVEEHTLRRGRELEDRVVAELDFVTPVYPERDFAAGARATAELLASGVPGVLQGVLLGGDRLGIPDLLRREAGSSALGDHHYVVGDVKSSARSRSDQVLQIMFYSRLLGELQERVPAYAYLVLRDRREERFAWRDYEAVLEDVECRVLAIAHGEQDTRPFLARGCGGCRWSESCRAELETAGDLSLLQGMTPGLRQTLEGAGVGRCAGVADMAIEPMVRRTHIESALLRRLKKAARARAAGQPLPEPGLRPLPAGTEIAVVHMLGDPFAGRVPYFGVLYPAQPGGTVLEALPACRDDELPALLALVEQLPPQVSLWHYGQRLPRWFDEAAWRTSGQPALESRMVDLGRRLRGAARYPGPVFGLRDHVRMVLGRDPDRAGPQGAVGLWSEQPDAEALLRARGRADLDDLAALIGVLRAWSQAGEPRTDVAVRSDLERAAES